MRFTTFLVPIQTDTCLSSYSARSVIDISIISPQINHSAEIKIGVSYPSERHRLPNTTKQHTQKQMKIH